MPPVTPNFNVADVYVFRFMLERAAMSLAIVLRPFPQHWNEGVEGDETTISQYIIMQLFLSRRWLF